MPRLTHKLKVLPFLFATLLASAGPFLFLPTRVQAAYDVCSQPLLDVDRPKLDLTQTKFLAVGGQTTVLTFEYWVLGATIDPESGEELGSISDYPYYTWFIWEANDGFPTFDQYYGPGGIVSIRANPVEISEGTWGHAIKYQGFINNFPIDGSVPGTHTLKIVAPYREGETQHDDSAFLTCLKTFSYKVYDYINGDGVNDAEDIQEAEQADTKDDPVSTGGGAFSLVPARAPLLAFLPVRT
jgi:hypothetical protein